MSREVISWRDAFMFALVVGIILFVWMMVDEWAAIERCKQIGRDLHVETRRVNQDCFIRDGISWRKT